MAQRNARNAEDLARSERDEDTADDDLLWVMSDARGRRFLWKLLGDCGLYRQTYSPNNSEHCFSAGMRNVALQLTADATRVSTEKYLVMQQEAFKREEERKALNDERGQNDD